MKTYFTDIIPKLERFSKKLDELTLLTNQHWVVVDEITKAKNVYIFRENNQLLISQNGKVEKAKWEYLGNNSLLVEIKDDSFLFKHGFFDENVLALKIDGKDEYAFLVNENKYYGELNSIEKIIDFLNNQYLQSELINTIKNNTGILIENNKKKEPVFFTRTLETDKGVLKIKTQQRVDYTNGDEVFLNDNSAPNGKYTYGWPSWLCSLTIKDGRINLL